MGLIACLGIFETPLPQLLDFLVFEFEFDASMGDPSVTLKYLESFHYLLPMLVALREEMVCLHDHPMSLE